MLLRPTLLGCTNSLMDQEYRSFFMLKHGPEMKYFSHFLRAKAAGCTVCSQPFICSGFPASFLSLRRSCFACPSFCLRKSGNGKGSWRFGGGMELSVRQDVVYFGTSIDKSLLFICRGLWTFWVAFHTCR